MCKKAFYFILIGWLFVIIDIGPVIDGLDDGVGYFLIGIGMCYIKEKKKLHIPIALSFVLVPICSFISILRAFGTPSWRITFLRCIPPLLSLPIGIALSDLIITKSLKKKRKSSLGSLSNGQKKARVSICYIVSQVMDIFCILYFLPTRTSVIINNFNTGSPLRFIPLYIYIATMFLYLLNIGRSTSGSNYK